ncbi:unnamed protein product [Trichogramma brassicae]|uniref:Uncharacterized protein n=1 Tax=Trichogramma brassicae TaxID=86971 RepID=A0A6H5I5I5_9HYME|nr:unnamed protein product [Trichogramma brassicae]
MQQRTGFTPPPQMTPGGPPTNMMRPNQPYPSMRTGPMTNAPPGKRAADNRMPMSQQKPAPDSVSSVPRRGRANRERQGHGQGSTRSRATYPVLSVCLTNASGYSKISNYHEIIGTKATWSKFKYVHINNNVNYVFFNNEHMIYVFNIRYELCFASTRVHCTLYNDFISTMRYRVHLISVEFAVINKKKTKKRCRWTVHGLTVRARCIGRCAGRRRRKTQKGREQIHSTGDDLLKCLGKSLARASTRWRLQCKK